MLAGSPPTVSPVTLTLTLVLREDTEVAEGTVPRRSALCIPARPNPEGALTATTLNAAVTNPNLCPAPAPQAKAADDRG